MRDAFQTGTLAPLFSGLSLAPSKECSWTERDMVHPKNDCGDTASSEDTGPLVACKKIHVHLTSHHCDTDKRGEVSYGQPDKATTYHSQPRKELAAFRVKVEHMNIKGKQAYKHRGTTAAERHRAGLMRRKEHGVTGCQEAKGQRVYLAAIEEGKHKQQHRHGDLPLLGAVRSSSHPGTTLG